MPLTPFGAAARAWFESSFERATPVQEQGWARIAAGEHALLIAPTGSGKTLAAFLYCIDRLARAKAPEGAEPPRPPGVRVLYISPLKALVYDIERNLRAPLVGVRRAAEKLAAYEAMLLARAAGLPQDKLEEVTGSNGNFTEPMRAFIALHKAPAATRESDGFQALMRGFVEIAEKDLAATLALARECGIALPGTAMASQIMARVYGLDDEKRR